MRLNPPEPAAANMAKRMAVDQDPGFHLENGSQPKSPDLDLSSPYDKVPKPNWYARFLARFPYIVILAVIAVSVTLGVVALKYQELPDFTKPAEGFETRGTEIMDCSITHSKLSEAITRGTLSMLPSAPDSGTPGNLLSRQTRQTNNQFGCSTIYPPFQLEYGYNLVFKSKSDSNLFKADSLRALCHLEDTFIKPSIWTTLCRNPSVAFYTANLRNKECSQLNDEDIAKVSEELQECSQYYNDRTMQCVSNSTNCTLPDLCKPFGHIHQMFYYLADRGFAETAKAGKPFLKYAQVIVSVISRSYGLSFFRDDIDGRNIQEGDVTFVAGYFGENAKYYLFSDYLIEDARFFALAMALVLIIMLFYLRSPTLMLATVLNVLFSFGIAYFLYFFVLRMKFYPFVNLLGALLLIAVGADDVFIFHDMWEQSKLEQPNGNHAVWMSQAFYHAALSVTVTSLTTGAAFFSNLVSYITAIRCFGLFAGLGVMANLLLMLTWTPAVIVSIDIVQAACCKRVPSSSTYTNIILYARQWSKKTSRVYGRWFPNIIEKGRYIFLVLLFLLGVGGLVVTFFKPGLKLPTSSEFQLFPDWHPMEIWDKGLKLEFQFQLDTDRKRLGNISPLYSWGLRNKDNGDWLNPNDTGKLEFDKSFSPLKPESQVALLKFCHAAKNQSFAKPSPYNCFFDEVLEIGKEICSDPRVKFSPFGACCDKLKFPFPEDLIKTCLMPVIALGGQGYIIRLMSTFGAPVFNKTNDIVAMMMSTQTKYDYDANFEKMDKAYTTIHKFFQEQKALMPAGMKSMCFSGNGWQFRFYDLQNSIAIGTYSSIGLSLAVAAVVMLLTSRNVIITLYAIITILLAIAVTVGTIVLMGWELGILESISISLSVGLSIDFTIHYGVAYRVSQGEGPKERVHESFHRVGWAVAVAAVTTFLAGAAVMPSRILAYTKLGVFLMLVMSFSWIYSTFFFQSLCRVIGPRGNFCQIPSPLSLCRKRKPQEEHTASQELETGPYRPKVEREENGKYQHDYKRPDQVTPEPPT